MIRKEEQMIFTELIIITVKNCNLIITILYKGEIGKGVIFTLRQVVKDKKSEEYNSFSPYYLVYIQEGGEIKYNYTHSKNILDIYKKLAHGKDQVYEDLVEIFDRETKEGQDMKKYTNLLEKSIETIKGKKEEKGLASLFRKGGTSLTNSNTDGTEDFELISFLIIR